MVRMGDVVRVSRGFRVPLTLPSDEFTASRAEPWYLEAVSGVCYRDHGVPGLNPGLLLTDACFSLSKKGIISD